VSVLDGIEGLGKRRIEILYRNYASINELKKALGRASTTAAQKCRFEGQGKAGRITLFVLIS
jgi:excinuclease UvrABC nuclease subunit